MATSKTTASTPLFTLPILSLNPPSPTPSPPSGTVVCTVTSNNIYLLTFTSPPDNRLTTSFCQALLLALDIIEFSYPPGVVVTTSGIGKFFSNGLDLEHAMTTKGFWTQSFFKLARRLLTYPMPTIALINGHAFAGGIMLAMYHDYRIFNPSRGFLCLNELDLGVPLKAPMSSVFREKLSPQTYKVMVLEAKRFAGKDALDNGIVDALGGWDEATHFIQERKLVEKGQAKGKGVYGQLKREMYRETIGFIDGFEKEEKLRVEREEADAKESDRRERGVREWEANARKAKL